RLHEPGDRALACDPRTQCGARIVTLVEGAHALGNLTFARRDRGDLRAHVLVTDGDPGVLGDRVEQELGAHLPLRARTQLVSEAGERCPATGIGCAAKVERGHERLETTIDERLWHLERLTRDQLIEELVARGLRAPELRVALEIGADARPQLR